MISMFSKGRQSCETDCIFLGRHAFEYSNFDLDMRGLT